MGSLDLNLDHLRRTEKQKAFGYDFLCDVDRLEYWDGITVGEEYESARTYEVTKEDLVAFADGVLDPSPLLRDDEAAAASPYGEVLPHPIFLMTIAFWCIDRGRGSWIRTPGSMNPGQRIVWYEPIRVGDVIRMTQKPADKWIRRGRHYFTSELNFFDQRGVKKATWWATLILPKTKEDVLKIARA